MQDFLREKWGEAAGAQTQQFESEKKPVQAYRELKKQVENLPDNVDEETRENIAYFFKELQENIKRYVAAIDEFAKTTKDTDPEDIERIDKSRERAHDGLMEMLTILERLCDQQGLDTSWRDGIGYTRDEVRTWAQAVTEYLAPDTEDEA